MPAGDTNVRDHILDEAQRLLQTRGFSTFDLADLAREVGTGVEDVEAHFATKAELGLVLVERYTRDFGGALDAIDASGAVARERLHRYRDIYLEVIEARRLCLCGMLASEAAILDAPCRAAVGRFFDVNFAWVTSVLQLGIADGSLRVETDLRRAAESIVSGFEGIMLLAWARHDHGWFRLASDHLLTAYEPRPA